VGSIPTNSIFSNKEKYFEKKTKIVLDKITKLIIMCKVSEGT